MHNRTFPLLPAVFLALSTVSASSVPCLPAAAETADTFTFDDLDAIPFYFSSGAGGWGTSLTVYADGTFEGSYHDSDMGDTGDGYPNGTMYWSNFSGTFTDLISLDSLTCQVQLSSLETEEAEDVVEIRDGVRYISSIPYGVDSTSEMRIYLPGTPIDSLPEWIISPTFYEEDADGLLDGYGIYNVETDAWFYGTPVSEQYKAVMHEIETIDKTAQDLRSQIDSTSDSAETNALSSELYQIWDDELNAIWQILKEELSSDEMASLTQLELDWINRKEAAAEEAAAEYGAENEYWTAWNLTAAEYTESQVYVLASYLY